MAKNTTATIETLTAEVRVLMVGSRQITVSVYGQLDVVPDHEITPFGRVTPKDAQGGAVYVVGKHAQSGELCRALLPTLPVTTQRWIAARSRAAAFERKSDSEELSASKHERMAEEWDQKAAELLGESWGSAARYDYDAASNDNDAAEHDRKTSSAQTESERLSELAAAAHARHQAAVLRDKATAARAEAADLQTKAARQRQAAENCRTRSASYVRENKEWLQWEASEHERITAVAAEWAALPLIVLAGLR